MGSYATLYEIKWALDNGYNKYYLSYAYENSSIYKSKYDGFEFWTGREWLDDKTIYKNLCNNDERIKNFTDLNDYQEKYFRILDKIKQ
jgi:arginyl-tRNA--protein-N-Asp/Glu arginylyltransferase